MTETEIPLQGEARKYAAKCTRCGKQLVLTVGDDACPELTIDKWLKIIVCNPCGDFLENMHRLERAMCHVCVQVMISERSKSRGDVRAAAEKKLTELTQEFTRRLSAHYTTINNWDHEFVDMLLERPNKCQAYLRMEASHHRKAREQADREAAEKRQAMAVSADP